MCRRKTEIVGNNYPLVLTPRQASEYTGIGVDTLRIESEKPNCDFVIFVGNDRRYKRKQLEAFVDNSKYLESKYQ